MRDRHACLAGTGRRTSHRRRSAQTRLIVEIGHLAVDHVHVALRARGEPGEQETHSALALVLFDMGKRDEAIEQAKNGIAADPPSR